MMQITQNLSERFKRANRRPFLIGVCGRAGSGKTTLTEAIAAQLKNQGVASISYSGDWRFKLDSESRSNLISEKWLAGLDEYLRAVNQFNWWDFESIYQDLNRLSNGQDIVIKDAYNRKTGTKNFTIKLKGNQRGIIFYENCILGGAEILDKLDLIVFVSEPLKVCFDRIVAKDSQRRSFAELLARNMITLYSENLFFKFLAANFKKKVLVCDSCGVLGGDWQRVEPVNFLPVPITAAKNAAGFKGTIFCDLDGTLIKHVTVPQASGSDIEVIRGSAEKLREFKKNNYYLVLTTARPFHKIFSVLNKLKNMGLEFDQVICDLPVGPRHLINDSKDNEIRSISHALKRNQGIKHIQIK